MNTKPFSQACENNKAPILGKLQMWLKDCRTVLEVGSGTGQHAVHFAESMPHLHWQTSDLTHNHAGIQAWIDDSGLKNIGHPKALDVNETSWPISPVDAVFTANTFHIMSWEEVEKFFVLLPSLIKSGGILAVYGPFNYEGQFTSDSNQAFDLALKRDVPHRGLRDFNDVHTLAKQARLIFMEDYALPANNRLLIWKMES